jgi:hypothetical protein
MIHFGSFYGIITAINNFWSGSDEISGCYKLMTIQNGEGSIVNFVVTPATYFVDHTMVSVGDVVTGFYDADAPVPLIYPPQFQAIVVVKTIQGANVKVDYFNSQLVSSDGTLKINIAPYTQITLENGQAFAGNPANRNLIVIYGAATKSIPAQTTPYKIIVMCPQK